MKESMDLHYEMLRETSRTFALSIELLPGKVREAITLSYLLLRVSDYLEDNDVMEAARKMDLLYLWANVLRGDKPPGALTSSLGRVDESDPEALVARQAPAILDQVHTLPEALQEIIGRNVRETTIGMALWQEKGPVVSDEAGMDDYMHYVAGIVGYLITEVFAWHSSRIRERIDELMPLSREYGLALQTVNIIRGMRKDYERGWIFVPRTFYEEAGLTYHQLFDPQYLDRALEVVGRLADKADAHLRHGMDYIMAFPRHQHRIRLACMWPLFFAVKTLAVSRNNPQVIVAEAKMSRSEVRQIMRNTMLLGWSNEWLHHYYDQLAAST